MTRFHELVAGFLPDDARCSDVLVYIETDRGPRVRSLVAAGYQVYEVNPKQAARHRAAGSSAAATQAPTDATSSPVSASTRRYVRHALSIGMPVISRP